MAYDAIWVRTQCASPQSTKRKQTGRRRRSSSSSDEPRRRRSRSRRGRRSPSQASSSVAQGMIQVDVNHYTALVTQAAQAQAAAQAMAAVTPPHTAATLPASYGSKGQRQWTNKDSWQSDKWKGQSWKQGDWQQKNRWPQKKGAETERNGQRAGTNGSVMRKPQEKVRR